MVPANGEYVTVSTWAGDGNSGGWVVVSPVPLCGL